VLRLIAKLEYIKENYPDMGICLEVYNADFNNPAESREAVKRVVDWLNRE